MKKSPTKKPERLKDKNSRPAKKRQKQTASFSCEGLAHIIEEKHLGDFKNRHPASNPQRVTKQPTMRVYKDEQDFGENADLEEARDGVQVGNRFFLAFRAGDLDVRKGFSKEKGPRFPILRIKINSKAEIEIFGSHLEGEKHNTVTHLIHNKSQFELVPIDEPNLVLPALYSMLARSRPGGWTVSCAAGSKLKGDAIKTVFQGVSHDPDLLMILAEMEEIKKSSHDFYSSLPLPGAEMAFMTRRRIGEKLFDFLVRIVRSGEKKKLNLIRKCMDYLQTPTMTKRDHFTRSLLAFCHKHRRLPSPPELCLQIDNDGHTFSNPIFYKSLNEIGLGWMSRGRQKRK